MRNEERLRAANIADVAALASQEKSVVNPVEIATPVQIVDLPSKGLFYPEDHPWNGRESVEIRFMTAKDEDILINKGYIQKGVVLDKLISSLLVDKNVNLDSVLLCDKAALTVASRITGYGSEYVVDVDCPSCGKKSNKHVFDLDLFTPIFPSEETLQSAEAEMTENKTFVIELPKTKAKVEVRLLDGADDRRLTSLADTKKKQNLPDSTLTDQMKQFIVSVNNNQEKGYISKFIDVMPAFDAKYLRRIYNKISPNINNKQEFVCPNCYASQEVEVPLTVGFFWPE